VGRGHRGDGGRIEPSGKRYHVETIELDAGTGDA